MSLRPLRFLTQEPLPSAEDISLFERRWELHVPSSLRRFWLAYGGGIPDASNDFYPIPPGFEEFHQEYALPDMILGIRIAWFLGLHGRKLTVETMMHTLSDSNQLERERLPFAGDGCGNYLMLATDRKSNDTVFFWDHAMGEFAIAHTFDDLLNALTSCPW